MKKRGKRRGEREGRKRKTDKGKSNCLHCHHPRRPRRQHHRPKRKRRKCRLRKSQRHRHCVVVVVVIIINASSSSSSSFLPTFFVQVYVARFPVCGDKMQALFAHIRRVRDLYGGEDEEGRATPIPLHIHRIGAEETLLRQSGRMARQIGVFVEAHERRRPFRSCEWKRKGGGGRGKEEARGGGRGMRGRKFDEKG